MHLNCIETESMSMTNHVIPGKEKSPLSSYSPNMSGTNYEIKEKQKEDAIRLGVEFSLLVAEAMFLLSDDLRSMLRFCRWLMIFAGKKDYNGPMVGRVFHVIEYVFETYIKPKNQVYSQDNGTSIHWQLIETLRQDFVFGIRSLAEIVAILNIGGVVKPSLGFELYKYKEELNKLEEKLRSVKDVSEANGWFGREVIDESNIVHLWTSLFETTPPQVMNSKSKVDEFFRPLVNEAKQNTCCRILDSLVI